MKSEERQRRKAICHGCEHRLETRIATVLIERCGQCGCILQGRITIGCPMKKF